MATLGRSYPPIYDWSEPAPPAGGWLERQLPKGFVLTALAPPPLDDGRLVGTARDQVVNWFFASWCPGLGTATADATGALMAGAIEVGEWGRTDPASRGRSQAEPGRHQVPSRLS